MIISLTCDFYDTYVRAIISIRLYDQSEQRWNDGLLGGQQLLSDAKVEQKVILTSANWYQNISGGIWRKDLNVATESAITNHGSILPSFRDMTMRRTTDRRWQPSHIGPAIGEWHHYSGSSVFWSATCKQSCLASMKWTVYECISPNHTTDIL